MNLGERFREIYDRGRQHVLRGLGGVPQQEVEELRGERDAVEREKDAYEQVLRSLKHDGGNRLNVIMGRAELLEQGLADADDDPDPDEILEQLGIIQDSSKRLDQQLEDAAELSKDVASERILLQDTIKNCVAGYHNEAESYGIDLEYTFDTGGDPAYVDVHPLFPQVFDNLIQNTIDHADADRARLAVDDAGDEWKVRYEDDGRGIPTDIYDNITERGKKGEGSDGTGYGMDLCAYLLSESGADWELGPPTEAGGNGFRMDMYLEKADEPETWRGTEF